MRVEVLFDVAVSPNLAAKHTQVTCAYPLSARLADDTLLCLYRQGATKHSHDGILVLQQSADGGRSWSAPQVVFDGRQMSPTQTVITGGLCQTPSGALLASIGTIEGLPPGIYPFSDEGSRYPIRLLITRSDDGGATWSAPVHPDLRPLDRTGVTAPPFVVADGTVCVPIECRIPSGVNATALIRSHDDGHTFAPVLMVAADDSGHLNLCDARFTVLPDQRVLALLWTFIQGSERTIEVRRTVSDDHGQSWSAVEPIGFVGQITAPLAFAGDCVLAASNYRHAPLGSLLWYSVNGGTTWAVDRPIRLWDGEHGRMDGQPVVVHALEDGEERVWDELQRFSFGTPDLRRLADGTVVYTYYATLQGVIHVRAAGLRVVATP